LNIPVVSAVTDVFKSLFGLGAELIEDKDKLNEFNFKLNELQGQLNLQLIQTTTVPWVDGTVKLLFAFNSLWRPLGGAAMTAFGIYAYVKGIQIPEGLHAVFDAAFPAWGLSRHINKQKNGG
jgi:hypothetical protein